MAPNRGTAIGVFGERTEGIACLEGEVLLDRVDGREVVVLDFAELQEAISSVSSGIRRVAAGLW